MNELDNFKPFDAQTLKPIDFWEMQEIRRAINMLVEEVKELKKK